jgi:hypothetical protein
MYNHLSFAVMSRIKGHFTLTESLIKWFDLDLAMLITDRIFKRYLDGKNVQPDLETIKAENQWIILLSKYFGQITSPDTCTYYYHIGIKSALKWIAKHRAELLPTIFCQNDFQKQFMIKKLSAFSICETYCVVTLSNCKFSLEQRNVTITDPTILFLDHDQQFVIINL